MLPALKIMFNFSLVTALLVFVSANEDQDNLWENSGHFQGDIVIADSFIFNGQVISKNGVPLASQRWPGKTMKFKFHANLTAEQRTNITLGFTEITEKTGNCILFSEAPSTATTYVHITNKHNGCYAMVGYGSGIRTLNLQNPGCISRGTIMHETLHALGFYHMQSDMDRDNHVIIKSANIKDGMAYNFAKMNNLNRFGVPYDLNSIMHYKRLAFSKNGEPTIIAIIDPEMVLGGSQLTDSDIAKLKIMYSCP